MSEHQKARMQKNQFSNICNIGFGAAMNGAYVLGVIYSAFGILKGTMSYGTLTAILQLINQIQSPFANITGYLPKYYAMIASAERLMEVENYKMTDITCVKNLEEVKKIDDTEMVSMELDQVTFAYKNRQAEGVKSKTVNSDVFQNLTLSVQKGDYIAITGMSGCGKSTLLKIFMGLYVPQAGRAEVVLNRGQRLPITEFCRLFAYVPQGNYLMSGSIREVITFGEYFGGDSDAHKSETVRIQRAVELVCADFIITLKQIVERYGGAYGRKNDIYGYKAVFYGDTVACYRIFRIILCQ